MKVPTARCGEMFGFKQPQGPQQNGPENENSVPTQQRRQMTKNYRVNYARITVADKEENPSARVLLTAPGTDLSATPSEKEVRSSSGSDSRTSGKPALGCSRSAGCPPVNTTANSLSGTGFQI